MRQRLLFILSLLALFVAVFALGKVAFLWYNHAVEAFSITDTWQVIWHGLTMDLSTAAYLTAIPWLCCLVSLWWGKMPLRRLLLPYYIVVCTLVSAIVVGDTVMYGFWKFKLDSTIFPYLRHAEGATNSVSPWFIVVGLAVFALLAAAVAYLATRLTPRRVGNSRHRILHSLALLLVGGCLFLCMRGGVRQSTMNVGVAYYSPSLFLNHAAVNPAFSLMSSLSKNKDFASQFRLLDEEEREETFSPLYTQTDGELTDTLLRTERPNVLIVLMESFGGKFVEELGGVPGVAPNMSRLIREGIFWDNMYANSFRTDRGTVSTLSGWTSYPTVSLMRIPGRTAELPSIAHTLNEAGYESDYLYGGDIKIMGKRGYLVATGYGRLTSIDDFPLREANDSKWGVNDRVTARRAYEMLARRRTDKPWHMVFQTLSSHEPYKVPYHRLNDEVLNAFAFTDECIGELVDSLRTLPLWDNTLIILLPDHNSSYGGSYQDPEFFHCPMLWIGGAIKQPGRIHTLLNQSDLAATLLGQMGLPHSQFPWSRNVLSKGYTYPFVYSTYPSGILFKDSTGVTVFDTNSLSPITEEPSHSDDRTRRAKAILQTSYTLLSQKKVL